MTSENSEAWISKHDLISEITHYMKYAGAEGEHDPWYDPKADVGYQQAHVDQLDGLLTRFLQTLQGLPNPKAEADIMAAVQTAVLGINALNDSVQGCMIETGEREMLCDFFCLAANEAGLACEEDITDEWRDW